MKGLALFGTMLICLPLLSALEPRYESTAKMFGFSSWKGVTRVDYRRVLNIYELPDLALKTNSPSFKVYEYWEGERRTHLLKVGGLRIQTGVLTNVISAQEALIKHFSHYPEVCFETIPNGIGDRGYNCKWEKGNSVTFTRNNVFVHVALDDFTGKRKLFFPVESIARKIDEDILKKSTSSSWFSWLKGE